MKVIVSCGGKFHAFNLAEQLDKNGYLGRLITSYYSQKRGLFPQFRKDNEKIDSNKVVANILPLIIDKGISKIGCFQELFNINYHLLNIFDDWAKTQLIPSDLFVGWSGYSLKSLRKAKQMGAITVLERGSSHIQFQKEILEEEYKKFGCKKSPVNELVVQKELLEYDEADYVSIPSTFVKETFVNKGFDLKKLIQVPYGVEPINFKRIPKMDKTFRIIFIGGLTLQKGVQYLVKAFSELNLREAELLLIGSISREIKPILGQYEGSYRLTGTVSHLELYKYLCTGSVFVLPSVQDGFGMVILQAMACGLPVICTTNTGGADIIREGSEGFIVPTRDIGALKEKILYFYEHENERKIMSEMALKRAQEFTWDAYGDRMIKMYKNILVKDN